MASILGERLFELTRTLHYSITVFYTALACVVHCIGQDVVSVRAESKASDSVRVSLHCVCYVIATKVPDLGVCVCVCCSVCTCASGCTDVHVRSRVCVCMRVYV